MNEPQRSHWSPPPPSRSARIAWIVVGIVVTALGISLAQLVVGIGEPRGFETILLYVVAVGVVASGLGIAAIGLRKGP